MNIITNNIELEGAESAESVLAQYNPVRDIWNLPENGPFWDAVHMAHLQGRLGEGKKIAVIDGAFDFSIPRIRMQAGEGPRYSITPDQPTAHGTIVALFIGRVAPKCKLDLYEITVDGKPNAGAVQQAIKLAVESDAMVINLSLGQPRNLDWSENKPCSLCAAAERASAHNKLVVAAAGNNAEVTYCPARDAQSFAVGYQSSKRWVENGPEGAHELAKWAPPTYSQSWLYNNGIFTVKQEPGVAGSSFASPLIAGFSALLDRPLEVRDFTKSVIFAGAGAVWLQLKDQQHAEEAFINGLNHLPHRHYAGEIGTPCAACACFVHDLYVNAGLHYMMSGMLDRAEDLLRVAVWLNPLSADANANLGRLMEERALISLQKKADTDRAMQFLAESLSLYDAAISTRPGFSVYEAERRKILQIKKKVSEMMQGA